MTRRLLIALLMLCLSAGLMAGHAPGRLIVHMDDTVTAADFSVRFNDAHSAARNLGLTKVDELNIDRHRNAEAKTTAGLDRILVLSFPEGANLDAIASALAARPGVVSVEKDGIGEGGAIPPNDTHYGVQWALNNTGQNNGTPGADINAEEGWTYSTGSSSMVVAVLDTGIDFNHPEFAGRTVAGYDFVNNDADPTADHYHGVACAGIIAANEDNSFSTAGIDWNAKIMPVKVLDANNSGLTTNLASGITWAADNGAQVISMSLINYPCNNNTLGNALQYARDLGVVVISSAGNNGIGNADVSGPGCYEQTISVGATDRNDTRASWSATGNALDVTAPGVSVPTTYEINYSDTYRSFGGTSAACPHVAAAASLMLAMDGSLTHDEIKTILETSGDDQVGPSADDLAGWDDQYGWGRLNLGEALKAVTAPVLRRGAVAPKAANLSAPVTFSVIYTGAAAPSYLDLVLTGPSSGTYALSAATSGHPALIDGDFTNGERYEVTLTFTDAGDYSYHFEGSNGTVGREPLSGFFTDLTVLNVLGEDVATSETSWDSETYSAPLSNTHANDGSTYNLYEVTSSGGKPANRYSLLNHDFIFNVAGGEKVTFFIKARKTFAGVENDNFNVLYNTGGSGYATMFVISSTQYPVGDYYSFELPASTAGTMTIKVTDTDHTPGNQSTDSLVIEHMFIRSEGSAGGCTAAPTADFSGTPVSGDSPLTVDFTDLSTGGATAWSWTFGDGGTSTDQNPSHTYTAAGTYNVSLTASNACGSDIHTKSGYITVTTPTGGPVMHIDTITVTRQAAGGPRYQAEAVITVVDEVGQPVSGATVTADYTGPNSGTVSGTTDSFGQVTLVSGKTKKNLGTTWCFSVTGVSKAGASYDSGANVETSDCE